ncbi:MAG: hypothetical protein GFH27_549301n329 [Chloroflexi bacterium AL-W]|nr:hypothetical protein [Chloroflexi bacterium AL-N1]NOK68523.1 hypothetical protein [Chloroflexi bacterium AL-N10]NOK74169.1 hypothetical protein [Chloroflexi bacterium AL-N5]NOK83136.1 hypothetical protein [Chloroflexi bacterium AL-W]NOK90659.1 hypothetical protein [Chloroflexi bacterium AL-N15]
MKSDYYAVLGPKEYENGFQGIDYNDVDAATACYHVLVATDHKDDRDIGANALRSEWAKKRQKVDMGQLSDFLMPPLIDLSQLPLSSFYIQFAFKLLKPYISRDDNQFYIVDNPIVRDKVFCYPMVRATAWKGSLRHALWQMGNQKEDEQIRRLFGTANDDQPEEGNRGRLYFYPTFFTQTGLEVINPHDRERRVGKNPILIESVPIGATGTFTLLYTPLDCVGKDWAETCQQVAQDLELTTKGVEALFTIYGFGAKTSSGFGLAEDKVHKGTIVVGGLNYEIESSVTETASFAPPQPDLPRYLAATGQLHADFVSETGNLKSEAEYQRLLEVRGQTYGKKEKQLYAKAKGWWEREGQYLAQQPQESGSEPELVSEAPYPYPLACETFGIFADMPAKAEKLANALRRRGGDV